MSAYGIQVRTAFQPDTWELLQSFRTSDFEYARAVADRIGRAVARPVPIRVAVVDPWCKAKAGCQKELSYQWQA